MTDPEKLAALAANVEALSGPDREVDAAIFRTLAGGPSDHWYKLGDDYLRDDIVLPVTASLDAAMTLVPSGWHYAVYGSGVMHIGDKCTAQLEPPLYDAEPTIGHAATAPLALTAAALRARAASTPSLNAEIAGMGEPSNG